MALAAAIATGRAAFIGTGLNDRDPSGSLDMREKKIKSQWWWWTLLTSSIDDKKRIGLHSVSITYLGATACLLLSLLP